MNARREAVIVDVDGTLVDTSAIRHVVAEEAGKPDSDILRRASAACPPHQWVLDAVAAQRSFGRAILVVTARKECYRQATSDWLRRHMVLHDGLFMRPDDDPRPDIEVKADILALIEEAYRPAQAFDDNPDVVRLWQKRGIPVTIVPGWTGA